MRSLLIVNADDFGISEGVNLGIVEAHRRGILTSATVMANAPAFEHALHLGSEHPTLAIGVHLNLTAGSPLLPPSHVPDLVDRKGRFPRAHRLLRRLSLGRVDLRQVESELGAQVERVLHSGLHPDHLDSHHHLHTHPALHPLVVRMAQRYGIGGVRCPVELGCGGAIGRMGVMPAGGVLLKALLLGTLGTLLRARVRRAGLATTDHFRGLALGSAFSSRDLQETLRELPEGSVELMCHPGYPGRGLELLTSYSAGRETELAALLDPANRSLLEGKGVVLGSYSDLSR